MLALKYLLVILGIGLFGSSGALVVYDIYLSSQLRRLLGRRQDETAGELVPAEQGAEVGRPLRPVRWGLAQRLAAAGVLPLLVAYSIVVVPDGFAGVRVSQIWGARPGTLYPGVHLITPLVDSVELYDTREQVYTTAASYVAHVGGSAAATSASAGAAASAAPEVLTVQAREGLNIGLAVSVRYRVDPQRLSYIHANLPRSGADGGDNLPATGAELHHARNICDQARGVAAGRVECDHFAAGERWNYCARSAAAGFEAAGRVRAGTGRIAVERAGKRAVGHGDGNQAEAGENRGTGSGGAEVSRREAGGGASASSRATGQSGIGFHAVHAAA